MRRGSFSFVADGKTAQSLPASHARLVRLLLLVTVRTYTWLLFAIAGLGGFLYGYDVGIIGAALLYLNRTMPLGASQESMIVAAVLAGGTISSLVAGALADIIGRRRLMIAAGVLFLSSVLLIVAAHGFEELFMGRLLQGLSAGMIAVVIPLYLAETLPANVRGRGTAGFQLMLTIGILVALAVGTWYTRGVETAAAGLKGAELVAVLDKAWRGMFFSAVYPGIFFLAGTFVVTESPRWLLQRKRVEAARAALLRSREPAEAEREFAEMEAALSWTRPVPGVRDSVFQPRYMRPFLLACTVLGLTQATGINSILQFVVVILQKAGLPAGDATEKATYVTGVNVIFTVAGLLLVDRIGRKVLLKIGTGTVAAALILAAVVFSRVEAGSLPISQGTGYAVVAALALFVAGFAIGPGVCVWLALSELMPTRIRSLGMGFGLLINQGISTAIAAMFLPVVQRYGYSVMFAFWAVCTVGYFAVAAFWLPETKGRTLEEIEADFA
jgi:sugar porter (SP) family MFS transporter